MSQIRIKICFDMFTRNKDMACMSIATQRRGEEIELYRNKVYVCY